MPMNLTYKKAALLEVDIQNDFCPAYTGKGGREHPEGALAVPRANEIIDTLNTLAEKFHRKGAKVLATQDWHPEGHISFAASHQEKKTGDAIIIPTPEEVIDAFCKQFPKLSYTVPAAVQQILWPVHCLQNSEGANFSDDLDVRLIDFVFRKGYRKHVDSYSAFFENDRCTSTDLYAYLKEQHIDTLFIAGLATDYCVFYTIIDSLRLGFKTFCVEDASRGINVPAGSLARAITIMKEKGTVFLSAADL